MKSNSVLIGILILISKLNYAQQEITVEKHIDVKYKIDMPLGWFNLHPDGDVLLMPDSAKSGEYVTPYISFAIEQQNQNSITREKDLQLLLPQKFMLDESNYILTPDTLITKDGKKFWLEYRINLSDHGYVNSKQNLLYKYFCSATLFENNTVIYFVLGTRSLDDLRKTIALFKQTVFNSTKLSE